MSNKINLFSLENDNNVPEAKPTSTPKAQTVDDLDARKRKRNNILKWVIALLAIGGIFTAIYFACFYSGVKSIRVTSVDPTSSKNNITVNDGNTQYIVDYSNENNSWAEIYYNAGNETHYKEYAKTTGGATICFPVVINAAEKYMHIGDFSYVYDPNPTSSEIAINEWIRTTTASAQVPVESISFWSVLYQFLPMLILVGLMVWYMRKVGMMQGGAGGEESIFGMGKSQAKLAQSNVKFSDVAGIEEEKAELIEIVDYLKNPEKYAAMGARTPRGVILYGPPGTGKTLLAKAVAGEAKTPFFQVSGSAFEDMLVGVGAKRVRDLFTKAKKAAPSIIFIDELDSVASKRGKFDMAGGGSGLADQTINQLLAEMDGFSTRTGVVVMAATNRLDVLDSAILRPGRFDRHIQVNLPDIKEREAILKIHARNKNLSSKVRLSDIARRTPGFSGAQLENVLNEATLLTVRFNKSAIGMEEIDEAIDRVIAGPAKKSRVITDAEKKQIAYHEAGHALVGLHTPGSDVVEKITIIPRGQAAGYTLSTPEKQEISIQKKSDLLALVAGILGGRASEEVIYGKTEISTGAANDLFKVTNIVRSMVMQLGMSSVGMTQLVPSEGQINPYQTKMYSENTAQKADKEIESIIEEQYAKAKKIISENRKELDLIVKALLILETIVKDQIDYIHKNLKLPKEALERQSEMEKQKQSDKEDELASPTPTTSKPKKN